MITAKALSGLRGIRHGFFTREGGVSSGIYASLNCGLGSNDNPAHVRENRARVAAQLGIAPEALLSLHQDHTSEAILVDEAWNTEGRPVADGMATHVPGLALSILAADCVPVLFAEPRARLVAVAHAGWRGALAGILEATLAAMENLGAEREHICAALGPCIGPENYEVGPDLRERVLAISDSDRAFFVPTVNPERWLFDLPGYVAERLSRAEIGIIERHTPCTYLDEKRFYSYRRATHRNEADFGRQISAILLVS